MTTPNGRYEPGDPAARARDGIHAPVRPVVADRGGRGRAGLIGVAVVAIIVFAAGIGLVGSDRVPVPSARASASPSGPVAQDSPTPTPRVSPPPTELPGLRCLPVSPGDLPEARIWSTGGSSEPVTGVPGPPDWALASPATAAWPVPSDAGALRLTHVDSIILVPDDRACIRYAVAEFLAVGDTGGRPVVLALGESNVSPPRARLVLGTMDGGDWILRVVVYYSTGVAGDEDQAVMERFFRVISDDGVQATPLVSPAVACAPLAPDAPAPGLQLVVGVGDPVPGSGGSPTPSGRRGGPLVAGIFPDQVEVRVAGDACATSWRIDLLDPVTAELISQTTQENPRENPYSMSQNRIRLQGLAIGRTIVRAVVRFGRDREARATWELVLGGPPVPTVVVTGPDGRRVTALPGCGVTWSLPDGTSAGERCRTFMIPDGLQVLDVRSDDTVRLDVPDWQITAWNIGCGTGEAGGEFLQPGDCGLGGDGDGSAPARPVRFLPFPGRTVTVAWLAGTRNGVILWAQYYVGIVATP